MAAIRLGGGTPITILSPDAPGSFGCLVTMGGVLCILSSGHVLTRAGNFEPDDPVYQEGGARLRLGTVLEAAAPNPYGSSTVYELDAALARVGDAGAVSASIGGWKPPKGPGPLSAPADRVFIWSALSPRTSNTVIDPNWSGVLGYPGGGSVRFRGLVKCNCYSKPGDSGSVVLNAARQVVGLHVGGDEQFSFFCPVSALLARWPDLQFLTADPAA